MTRWRWVVVVSSAIALAGCGSSSETSNSPPPPPADSGYEDMYAPDAVAQEEWETGEGEAREEFNDGYADGWESGCDIAFEGSPDGSLYDQGDEYTVDDCYALAPLDASDADVPYDVPADPYTAGLELGESDGCIAAFDELPSYGVLNWGEDSFDDSVCP